jgi:two-component system, chemotaxis family, chemotaxis protein CheY
MSYSVLVVDDSSVVRRMVKRALTMSGVEVAPVHEAANGHEALAILDHHWVDIVFADINMPGMTGAELLATMAKSPVLAATPVVIVSSEHSEERRRQMTELGARAYLVKPFRPESIKQVMWQVLVTDRESSDA